ncbi:hypothetical protein ACFSGX_12800 [Sphingomonas arantia]|uniref:Transmembrane protein n=1 Tax=Sphingomonas arantia TaxID=1460676 RepID=A0ABW4U1N3_9SPHN
MTRPNARRMIDAIERTPLAVPMALLTAAAASFLAFAVPAAVMVRAVGMTGVAPLIARVGSFGTTPRAVLMLAAALIAGGAVWWLFHRLENPRQPVEAELQIDLFAPEEVEAPAPAPQLRRADAHPDAPARRPLFAASDLGTPMDDIDPEPLPFGRPPLFVAPVVPVAEEVVDDPDTLLLDESYASVAPDVADDNAVIDPQHDLVPEKETIAALMARLERGLERRGGGAMAQQAAADGGLRDALDELRRMTAGR